jgi:hypothetical protein
VPPAEPQGCHGAATVAYKQATNDPGGQGSAIGGQGNSDDNPFNGQAHSAVGRGETLLSDAATPGRRIAENQSRGFFFRPRV